MLFKIFINNKRDKNNTRDNTEKLEIIKIKIINCNTNKIILLDLNHYLTTTTAIIIMDNSNSTIMDNSNSTIMDNSNSTIMDNSNSKQQ